MTFKMNPSAISNFDLLQEFRMQLFIFHICQHTASTLEFLLAKVVGNLYDSLQYTIANDMIHITFKII